MTVHECKRHSPLISFILPDYNISEEMLRECVDSIMSLHLQDDEREIILVDDGSAVPPSGIIDHYGKHITYLRQENQGLSAARNAGLALAHGEYIQFIDGDDCLITESYDKIVDRIKEGLDTDIMMFEESRTDKHADVKHDVHFRHTTCREFLQKHNLKASACGYMFKRCILGELRFKGGLLHEDELFTPLLMCRANTLTYTSTAAYYYRQRDNSITTATSDRHIDKRLHDFFFIIEHLHHLSAQEEYKALRRRVNQLCMDYIYNVATACKSYSRMKIEIDRMKEARLYPIPLHLYTMKYLCFSIITRTYIGCRLLHKYAIRK